MGESQNDNIGSYVQFVIYKAEVLIQLELITTYPLLIDTSYLLPISKDLIISAYFLAIITITMDHR